MSTYKYSAYPSTPTSNPSTTRHSFPLIATVATLGVFLNQSGRSGGFNLSLSDLALPVVIIALVLGRMLKIPVYSAVFFSAIVTTSAAAALWGTPVIFGVEPNGGAVASELVKTLACFLFFVCGYSLARARAHIVVLQWFAFGATFIALLGVAMELVGFRPDLLYYAGVRFNGLMIDPNYYATLSCAAVAVLLSTEGTNRILRLVSVALLVSSVLLSGSKTGLLTLIAVAVIALGRRSTTRSRKFWLLPLVAAASLTVLALAGPLLEALRNVLSQLSSALPQLQRLEALLSDSPTAALAGGGSAREAAWGTALTIIERVPLWGVGAGSYQGVANALSGNVTLAHNTFLQLAAAWGVPLAALFFGWVLKLVWSNYTVPSSLRARDLSALGDIMVIFLIASLSLSLNNARMFWLFLGMIAYRVVDLRTASRGSPTETGFSSRRHGRGHPETAAR
jgi:O-antigen ligase